MPKLSTALWEALYARAIVTPDEARARILEDGLPGAGLEGLMAELERAKSRLRPGGPIGAWVDPGAGTWLPDQVWLLAIGATTAADTIAALGAEGWAPRDASDLAALGLRYATELEESRRRNLAAAFARR